MWRNNFGNSDISFNSTVSCWRRLPYRAVPPSCRALTILPSHFSVFLGFGCIECGIYKSRGAWTMFSSTPLALGDFSNLLLALLERYPNTIYLTKTHRQSKNFLNILKKTIMSGLRRCSNTKAPMSFKISSSTMGKLATRTKAKEDEISSVFVSVSGAWKKLLKQLSVENECVTEKGPAIILQISFDGIRQTFRGHHQTNKETRRRGCSWSHSGARSARIQGRNKTVRKNQPLN